MTKIDIFSGFLGAGKTTLIKKLIQEAYAGEKLVLIENEFGEIGIDSGFLQEAGIRVNEMNSGCICCSLVGDFNEALKQVLDEYQPDRILIEPSGVGKLSDVIKAVQNVDADDVQLNSFTTVADATKAKMYMKNFGEFYNNQIEFANSVVLSRTDGMSQEKLDNTLALLREHNDRATIITTPWEDLSGEQILQTMEHRDTLTAELELLAAQQEELYCEECGHHHLPGELHEHHHDHDHEHHDHEHHEHEHHEHEHHDHDHHEHEHHEHEHHDHEHHDHEHHEHEHHDHDHHDHEHHGHHHHDHHGHHHHHDADEVFTSWGVETAKKFDAAALRQALAALDDTAAYGTVLRAKGIVDGTEGWLHFDYVPGEVSVRSGGAGVIGRLCVIGAELKEEALQQLFGVK